MNILNIINKKKNEIKQAQIKNKTIRAAANLQTTKRELAAYKVEEAINKDKAEIARIKTEAKERRLAPLKAFGAGIKTRLEKRTRKRVNINYGSNQGNIFTQKEGFNPIYHSTSSGSNPFNQLGTNPKNNKPIKKKVIIYG